MIIFVYLTEVNSEEWVFEFLESGTVLKKKKKKETYP